MEANEKLIPRGPIGHRLCNELEGMLRGITADGLITKEETERIAGWLEANRQFHDVQPFTQLGARLQGALADGMLTTEEIEDLLFVVCKYTTVNPYFDQLRGGLQVLMGLLSGFAADAIITHTEVRALQSWIDDWGHLKGLWPYDECETIVTWMISNNRIAAEAPQLLELAKMFPLAGAAATEVPALTLAGVCATQPEIIFGDRQFVFTGESRRAGRDAMAARVSEKRGLSHDRITLDTDYLVVCDEGNQHWAFCCYGRKVEKAFQLRMGGHRIQIVHESDFWDSLVG